MVIALSVVFFFLILRFVVTLFNFISDPKLRRVNLLQQNLVSVLIPARNEAKNIKALLQSIERQDYVNYEVIILDDGSTDDTHAICRAFAGKHPKFKVIKGAELPAGWLGKNYACCQLAQQAQGEYLLFLDADELVYPGLINSAVHRIKFKRMALLSLFTNQVMRTLGEWSVVPLMHYVLLNLLPIRLIYLSKNPAFAAASGQFMLFDATLYHQYQWHKLMKDRVVEDVEIMKQIKASKLKGESLLANGLITCRMYTGYQEAINGFSKNFLAAFNYSVAGFICYLTVLVGGPLLVLSTLDLELIFMMFGLILLSRIMISLLSGQNAWYNCLLHPLQMFNLTVVGYFAVYRHLTHTNIWKGRPV